jgi:8-oxo-dGTP diphosphatase
VTQPSEFLDCVAFMLIANNAILVEKRSATKKLLPGALAIPGGHVEEGESLEAALVRELREELDITPQGFSYLCMLPHQAEELRHIHYFVVEHWTGEMRTLEAGSLHWLALDDLTALDLKIDVEAVEQYYNALTMSTRQLSPECRSPSESTNSQWNLYGFS